MGCRRIIFQKTAPLAVFVDTDIADMCRSVIPIPAVVPSLATATAVAVTTASCLSMTPTPLPYSESSQDQSPDMPTPPPPKEPYIPFRLEPVVVQQLDATSDMPDGVQTAADARDMPGVGVQALGVGVQALGVVQQPSEPSGLSVSVPVPVPTIPAVVRTAEGSRKQDALDAARKRIPIFDIASVHFGDVITIDVVSIVGGKNGVGQIRRHMTELTDASLTSVPMPHICPEFDIIKPASLAVSSAMLALVAANVRPKPVLQTHSCYMVQDNTTSRVWAVSACSALDSFVFAELEGAVVGKAFGVHGKTTVLLTNEPCEFGIVPDVVKMLLAWFVVTFNSKKSKYQFRIEGACSGYVSFMSARIKAYTAALGRVRNAGSVWQKTEGCRFGEGDGTSTKKRKATQKRPAEERAGKAYVKDVRAPKRRVAAREQAQHDVLDCSTVGVTDEAVRLKRYCREVNIVTLIGILVGEKVSLRM